MNKNTLLVVGALITVTTISIATKPSSAGLELPQCDVSTILDTPVSFIVDNHVLEHNTKQDIQSYFEKSLKQSNLILSNSCIPMTRSLDEIVYVDIDMSQVRDMFSLHSELTKQLSTDNLKFLFPMPNQYYGAVLETKYQKILGIAGKVEPNLSQQFFAITMGRDVNIVEHELGHLAWAQHSEGNPTPNLDKWLKSVYLPEYHQFLPSYARAYKCGTGGTVMSYENEKLPIYSNPKTTYRDEACGDVEDGDNARIVTESAQRIAKQMSLLTDN
ncbi:conserved hypothetical protein [Vibrio crassostreae]|nr:conserved hypothetical protein [Vibrio crassostreae]CAK2820507.1 conserved hypothetical protein [Vibrio crassostreae]CAK3039549.1 conserved hypothetical protein [Vibrio crassostreae]CAK3331402.1 conserved hypothetical protein [Vibrio crassostreae]CAK3335085.1 conserved hypothetical protein [Vibrio crassostreae]